MANDAALRTSLVWLAVVMVVVGVWTLSFKKVIVTYALGVLGIAGVLLPDWDYFERDYSRWFSPVSEHDMPALAQRSGFRLASFPVIGIGFLLSDLLATPLFMAMLCTSGGCSYQSEGLWNEFTQGFEG
ncbi:SIGNAL PEPTIDASE COMPLEX-LIKE PROTEIN DTM1 [Salix purpurea]|uniref:SIGNAL PEPTIDASE COMPLEX-LIKE PROTEIN DTM1 n=1 Tax=Salix purpurea TaxID=77065 RepID=A0A9Q0PCJ5_SALPP|nr:SIGNAL PEPTIDASE COMPLEX-LIKE PROTEIN DTM1 [Salix purpurea]